MKNLIDVYVMSFDGSIIRDSSHETMDEAQDTIDNFGSKWYFYPWPIIAVNKTVKFIGGIWINIKLDDGMLNILLKNKRIKTVQNIFKHVSAMPGNKDLDVEQFEDTVLAYLEQL
jgi:hypothetical protein